MATRCSCNSAAGLGQMKHVLGYSLSDSNNTFVVIVDMLARLGEAHWPSVLMGIGVMAFLMVFKKVPRLRKVPSAMLIVVIGILVAIVLALLPPRDASL